MTAAVSNVVALQRGSYDPSARPTPTAEQYAAFNAIFEHFNVELFGGEMPPVMLAFAKHGRSRGYYIHERWHRRDAEGFRVSEIALSPDHLGRKEREVASTIVHEMVHLWQYVQGTPSRRGYHNAQWAERMETLGLMPSNTGEVGGKRTGQKVTHYIIEGGAFARAFEKLDRAGLLPFIAGECPAGGGPKKPSDKSKTKYGCAVCGLNAWARPDANIFHCDVAMIAAN